MYLDRTEDEDQKMAERWKADADGILVFVSYCPFFLSLIPSGVPTWTLYL